MFWKKNNSHSIYDATHDEIILGDKPRDKKFERPDTSFKDEGREIIKSKGVFDLIYDALDYLSGKITPQNERSILNGIKECYLRDPASQESLKLLSFHIVALLLFIGICFCIHSYVGKNYNGNAANIIWGVSLLIILVYFYIAYGRINVDNPVRTGGLHYFILSLILRRRSYEVKIEGDKFILKPNYSFLSLLPFLIGIPIFPIFPLIGTFLMIESIVSINFIITRFPQKNFDRRLGLYWIGPYSRIESSIREYRFSCNILNLEKINEIKIGHEGGGYYSIWLIADEPIMVIRRSEDSVYIKSLAQDLSQFLNVKFNDEVWDLTGIEGVRVHRTYSSNIEKIMRNIFARF